MTKPTFDAFWQGLNAYLGDLKHPQALYGEARPAYTRGLSCLEAAQAIVADREEAELQAWNEAEEARRVAEAKADYAP